MKTYISNLSRSQKLISIGLIIAVVFIISIGLLSESAHHEKNSVEFSIDQSIKEIAPELGVTGKSLARDLGLPLDIAKSKPLKELDITQEKLDHDIEHVLSHTSTGLKYYFIFALVLFALVYLLKLGRPHGLTINERKHWYPITPFIVTLVFTLVVCGFWLGKSPNPMESIVKIFKAMVGLYPSVIDKVVILAFFLVLSIVGNKLICGWVCPFGAIQELVYSIPVLAKLKRRKLPFWLTNSIRGILFGITLIFLFGIVGGKIGYVIYHVINPFNMFNFDFDEGYVLPLVLASLLLSLFTYRPFCALICPFGFVSWITERLSLTRVRVNHSICTKCGACSRACPSNAAQDILDNKLLPQDCYSCSRCLNVCPVDAIHYDSIFKKYSDLP